MFPRDHASALDGDALGEDDSVALLGSIGPHQSIFIDIAQHLSHDDRSGESGCHLRVAAYERHAEACARIENVLKNLFHHTFGGGVFGQQQGGEKPQRAAALGRDIVGIDMHGVPTDSIDRKSNRIGLGEQVARPSDIDDGGVFTDAGTDDDAGVADAIFSQQPL